MKKPDFTNHENQHYRKHWQLFYSNLSNGLQFASQIVHNADKKNRPR
ncbi:hypothetical protein LHGZ1_0830 [Laribacter hongkongensis]|uniref:Uncharacterized protein n=1 Tax=Laribacter hongkongensis TaxID=168471 RepID=A0A248LGN4_9NEIS|nr:hypothetical protein LHGZ1_0830 [Laribacter hongkongensis]